MMKWNKIAALLASGLICCGMFAGCSGAADISNGAAAKDYPVTVLEVTLNQKPEGVVVLSENIADVILTMGYEITLKGKSAACTQDDLSILPNFTIDNVSEMKEAQVTLVLTDTAPTDDQKNALNGAGIQVIVIPPATSREDLTRLYTQVGSAMAGGKTGYTTAERAAESTLLSVDEVSRLVPEQETRPTACYLYSLTDAENARAATDDMLAGKLIEYAGMTNNFGDSSNGEVKLESLVFGNPDYIFCNTGLKDQITGNSAYAELNAVKNNHVYEIEASAMNRQGHTLFRTVARLASTVYPEVEYGGSNSSASSNTTSSQTSSASSSASSSPSSSSAPASSAPSSSAPVSSTPYSRPNVTAPERRIQQGGVLQVGDAGEDVLNMEIRLDELGYIWYNSPTGNFTANTSQCLKDFQLYNGLSVTGIANAQTLEALYSANAVRSPDQN